MKECDILVGQTYSDPSYIFSGVRTAKPPWSTPLDVSREKTFNIDTEWQTAGPAITADNNVVVKEEEEEDFA